MKRKLTYILIYLIFAQSFLTIAQIEPSITFTEDDGLAGNIVRDAIRDKNGLLWIGTDFGLSKYDGNSFENIYKSDGLPSNRVWALEADEIGNIYVGCYKGGLAIYRNDSIIKVLHQKGKFPDSFRLLHYSNYYKKLLIGTDNGLYILQDTIFIPVDFLKDSTKKTSILSITEYNSRIFFTIHGDIASGLYELNIDTNNLNKSKTSLLNKTRFVCTILNDTLYYGEYNGINKSPLSDIHKKLFHAKTDSGFFMWNMKPYNNDELIIGGLNDGRFNGNYCILNTKTGILGNNPHQIKAKTVLNIYNDTISNTFWLCTDNGITCLFDSPIEYHNFDNIGNIIDIGNIRDSLLVLTNDYLYLFHENNLNPILTERQISSKIISEYDNYNKRFKELYKIFDTSRGSSFSHFTKDGDKLFINTAMGAVSVPDLETYYPFAVGTFKIINNKSAYSNIMYLPLRYYPSVRDSIGYINPTTDKGKLADVFKIVESKGAYYFASSYSGIYVIKNDKISYLDESNSEIDNYLTNIAKDADDNIWCCSANGFLFKIGFADSLFVEKKLSASNGIIGNSIKWLIFNDNYLYVGTNKGLNIISTKKLYSENLMFEHFYNEYNGFEFVSAKSPVKDVNGNIYVHTSDKLIKIDADIKLNTSLKVNIEDVYINDKKDNVSKLSDKNLSYSTKKISLRFYAVKYPTSKNLSYNYKINNSNWVAGNHINLQSLRAGNYQILMDVFDKESNQHYSRTLTFNIKNPFWITWWFLLTSSLCTGILLFIIIRIRITNLKKTHDERTKLIIRNSELKLRSLQLQMNPHFIFNALNSIQRFIISKSTKDALLYLGNLAGIIRTNLENASEEYIHLSSEIKFLTKYIEIEKIRFKEKLKVKIENHAEDFNVLIPPMLVQPIVENSIKHGIMNLKGNGEINISFKTYNNLLIITVEDNGVGRDFTKNMGTKNHNSFGLNIIKQRLELLNEKNHTNIHKIEIIDLYNNDLPTGTKVIIQLLIKETL